MNSVICGSSAFVDALAERLVPVASDIHTFTDGAHCRAEFDGWGIPDAIVIGPGIVDVAPVNLVAAIRNDFEVAGQETPPMFLVVSGDISGSLVSRAHSAGAYQVLGLAETERLVSELEGLARSERPTEDARPGYLIPVMAARGGVGKSTLALLCAMAFAGPDRKVALVDMDLRFGNLAYLLGQEKVCTIDELAAIRGDGGILAEQLQLREICIANDVAFFAAPRNPEAGDGVTARCADLIAALRSVYDVVVVDTGRSWNDEHAELVQAADRVLLVMDQRTSSLESGERALELCMKLGVPLAHMIGVLNRCSNKAPIDSVSASIALRGIEVFSITEGNTEVDELVGLGCPEDLFGLKNPCTQDVVRMVDSLSASLGIGVGKKSFSIVEKGKRSIFSRFHQRGAAL